MLSDHARNAIQLQKTSDILDELADAVDFSAREMLRERSKYDEMTIRQQRNLSIRLRLLACEFCDIGD